ncbi:MAG TPA: hypothetical protein VFI21_03370 [Nocardioides sp.]|nr:hypothetical protein [Nocardioides sp.]
MSPRQPSRPTPPPPAPRISPLPFAGMIGLACVLFLDLGSTIVLPWWAVVGLVVVWIVLFVLACAWWTAHPRRLPWLPVVGLAIWVVVVVVVNLATR